MPTSMGLTSTHVVLIAIALLVLLPGPADAFGAGNIASISAVEGKNWRHGDIEDMLATVACLKGHKWKSNMIKRVYFGNWLRDYSQAVDVGTLAKVQAETIRVLVWILSFMSFGYATGEFEVTAARLGVYRPEEHIDNPKDYADNEDARRYDPRLRGPVSNEELAVDFETGMKNYISNERGGWATSAGYVKFSFSRAIHFGRLYTHGPSNQRKEENLAEALRCLGQGLHCLEDFGAHTNYTELALRELGYNNVFPHTGTQTQLNVRGKHLYPLVTGTFGGVDFLHSVLGEATDHFTQTQVEQSELDQMQSKLSNATGVNTKSGGGGSGGDACASLCDSLSKVPGCGGLISEAQALKASSDAQASANAGHGYRSGGYDDYSSSRAGGQAPPQFAAPPGSVGGPPGPNIPGTNTDPATIIPRIYPILEFRDKVVRAVSAVVSKIPGLEKLIETITEKVTVFVFSLLAPFIMPIIQTASKSLKEGSSAVLQSAAKHQFEVWTDPHSTDPTHSMLSKDHFSNILNQPAGQVAVAILQYVAPRVLYAWDHPDVSEAQVLDDCLRIFHHPALRTNSEIHRTMFAVVEKWSHNYRGKNLNDILSSESVRAGHNHLGSNDHSHGAGHGAVGMDAIGGGHGSHAQQQSHTATGGGAGSGGLLGSLASNLPGGLGNIGQSLFSKTRDGGDDFGDSASSSAPHQSHNQPQQSHAWGSFQPYQSAYAGGQAVPPEYNATPAADTWGQGYYSGGQGSEPAYSVPTAYQQGIENYGTGAYQQQPPPASQHHQGYEGGGGGYGGYDQGPADHGGRAWGQ